MKLEAPPSRYRVVERGGRLVVIDSQSGATPLKARELVRPVIAGGTDSDRPADTDPTRPLLLEAPAPVRPAASRALIAEPPSGINAAQSVAATVAGERRDDDGRLLLTTARWYDAKGPRTVALSKTAEQQLGTAILALVGAALVAVFLMIFADVVSWVIVFAAIVLIGRAKPLSTAWIDRLAAS